MWHVRSYLIQKVLDLFSSCNSADTAHYLVKEYELVHALVPLEARFYHLIGLLTFWVKLNLKLILLNHAL